MKRLAFLLSLLPALAFAQGGPPLRTDDPGTPGDGNWEINVAGLWEHTSRAWEWEAPLLDINYGWGERIQLKYEVAFLTLDEEHAGAKGGLGESLFGVKWRFFDQEEHGLDMSIYPQVELNNLSSSRRRGLTSGHSAVILPAELARKFGRFGVNLEAGYTVIETEHDQWLYGLAGGYEVTEQLELLLELHGTALSDFEDDELVLQAGLRQEINDHFTLLFAAGPGIRFPDDEKIRFTGYLGLQMTF